MKKKFLVFLLGGMMMPTMAQACPDDGDNDREPGVWRGPAKRPHAYINYNEANGVACVYFLSAVNDAEVIVYLNGAEINNQMIDAEEGSQIPIYLPTYGSGEFTIQVKSGSTLLATYYTTL